MEIVCLLAVFKDMVCFFLFLLLIWSHYSAVAGLELFMYTSQASNVEISLSPPLKWLRLKMYTLRPSMNMMVLLLGYFPFLFSSMSQIGGHSMPRQGTLEDAFRQACLILKYLFPSVMYFRVIWFSGHTIADAVIGYKTQVYGDFQLTKIQLRLNRK